MFCSCFRARGHAFMVVLCCARCIVVHQQSLHFAEYRPRGISRVQIYPEHFESLRLLDFYFILFSLSLSLSFSFRFSYTLREATALPKSHDDIPVGRHTSAIWRPCLCSVQKHAESFDKRLVDHEQYMVMTIVVLRTRRLLAIGLTT